MSFDLFGPGGAATDPLDVRFTHGFTDALDHTSGTGVTVLSSKTTIGNDGAAETVTVTFTPTVTDANYALQFFVANNTDGSHFHPYIDNVQLNPTAVQWNYQVNNADPAVQALGVGQTIQETYTVVIADEPSTLGAGGALAAVSYTHLTLPTRS